MQIDNAKNQIAASWQTANFVGAAFAGKLRRLNYYMNQSENENSAAPQVTKEEFERKLAQARKEAAAHGD